MGDVDLYVGLKKGSNFYEVINLGDKGFSSLNNLGIEAVGNQAD
jgi:hypothetical protein